MAAALGGAGHLPGTSSSGMVLCDANALQQPMSHLSGCLQQVSTV
jgi:hypothetical protein